MCGGRSLLTYLDLGMQPLANALHNGQTSPVFPLQLAQCRECTHNQLRYTVDPKNMFEEYLYVSDTSKTLYDYFRWLKKYIGSPKSVLEIACNSGMFLEMFTESQRLGIDPAKNLRKLSAERGLDVLEEYWCLELAKKLGKKFEVVIAVNVLPHVPDPVDFLAGCKEVIEESGKIYIQTSQCDMFKNNEWDCCYFEHYSYFTAASLQRLCNEVGLVITDAQKMPIHSKSFLLTLQEQGEEHPNIEKWKKGESFDTLEFQQNVLLAKTRLLEETAYKKVVGYGASAKSSVVLNYTGINVAYFVDDSPLKWGLQIPGTNIKIHTPEVLSVESDELCILMTAWNFKEEIVKKIKSLRPGYNDTLLYYVPYVHTMAACL